MEIKINKISECFDLAGNNSELISRYDRKQARSKFEAACGIEGKQYMTKCPLYFGSASNVFYKYIKNGLVDDGFELVVGSIQRSLDKIDELMDLDASSEIDKAMAQIVILDIVNCGEFARRLLEQYERYKATGSFHKPKFIE